MIDMMKSQPNPTYIFLKKQEAKIIKSRIEKGEEIYYSTNDSWIRIGKTTFNGWGKCDVERLFIKNEEKIKKSVLIEFAVRITGKPYDKLKNRARDYLENIYYNKEKQIL
jgi:hypothetical protein